MKLEDYEALADEMAQPTNAQELRGANAIRDLIKRVREAEEDYDVLFKVAQTNSNDLTEAQAENAQLREALQEISMGAGEFSRDPLQHCTNCVEAMKAIAIAVLSDSSEAEKTDG